MTEEKKMRRLFSTNAFERKIIGVVFLSAGIPVFIIVGFFYCMFSDLVYVYLNTGLASHFLHQFLILSLFIMAYYFLFVFAIAYGFAHRLVGAFPRILRELDESIAGKLKEHIQIRKNDYAKEFIERINKLIDRLP